MNKLHQGKYRNVPTAAIAESYGGVDDDDETVPAVATPVLASMNVEVSRATSHIVKGALQEPAYRDKWFGVIFLVHFAAMIAVTVLYATGTLEVVENGPTRRRFSTDTAYDSNSSAAQDEFSSRDFVTLLSCFLMSLCSAPLLALVAMKYMLSHGVQLIQGSLYFAIGLNVAIGIMLVLLDHPTSCIGNFVLAAILTCYAKAVWHRIPFAAANLKAAVTCVSSNLGMVFLGLASIPLFAVWFGMWAFVLACVMSSPWMKAQEQEVQVTDDAFGRPNQHEEEQLTALGFWAIAALLLSFYWTWHVVRNVVHTTLAGTVGTWWFLPHEASGCCSQGLRDSLSRSLTYSFGSICLGSLIVAVIEVLKTILQSAARNRRGGVVRMIAQCLLGCIERIVEYFNKWAFIYVGLYGYSYVEAGKNVITLFRQRGWTTIISDSLINRMLGMMCLCIALFNALAAVIWTIGSPGSTMMLSAIFSFFMGLMMSSMTFGVLVSAVDSIIVLYAEAPAEFKDNHPALCQELEDTWTQAWPDVFSPGIVGVAAPVV